MWLLLKSVASPCEYFQSVPSPARSKCVDLSKFCCTCIFQMWWLFFFAFPSPAGSTKTADCRVPAGSCGQPHCKESTSSSKVHLAYQPWNQSHVSGSSFTFLFASPNAAYFFSPSPFGLQHTAQKSRLLHHHLRRVCCSAPIWRPEFQPVRAQ